ncbi:MAG: hypothetical protein WD852_07750 [Methyloceanibacter sp.]
MERPSDAKGAPRRRAERAKHVRHTKVREPAPFPRAKPINRKSLLSGTTLVSSGTTFRFEDDLDDVWGEVSAGVNFFNPSATTAVFAKVDVTFGDDVEGIGVKAGMRVSW